MSKAKRPEIMKATSFLSRLHATVDSLPTEAEKREALQKIDALVDFLSTLSGALSALPTAESAGDAKRAIETLQSLMAKVEANPALVGLTAGNRPQRIRTGRRHVPMSDASTAKADLDKLQSLPTEEIRTKLLDEEGFSLSRLRGMASVLGISGTEKLPRESLAHQIVTKIGNYRGYQRLSGEGGDVQSGVEGSS